MTNVLSNFAINFDAVDFYLVTENAYDSSMVHNVTFDGFVFPDVVEVDWQINGGYGASLFGGSNITIDGSGNITGGTVTGYAEEDWNGSAWVFSWGIANTSLSATAIYQAFLTPSTSDDTFIIQAALVGDDSISGSSYADLLRGYGGNDNITGGGGNDVIDGGAGTNTAYYSGMSSQYTVANSGSTTSVTDNVSGRDGADTLSNVQLLHFSDKTIAPLINPKDTTAAAAEIFQYMSGQVPDQASVNNAISVLSTISAGLTTAAAWDAVGASLADSSFAPQFAIALKGLGVDAFISRVTQDILGSALDSPALHNMYDIFKAYYAAAPDASDPTGDVRARGSFVADILHEASDVNWGPYYTAGQAFIIGTANNTAHYNASLFS